MLPTNAFDWLKKALKRGKNIQTVNGENKKQQNNKSNLPSNHVYCFIAI
jgi:hypothetical protein